MLFCSCVCGSFPGLSEPKKNRFYTDQLVGVFVVFVTLFWSMCYASSMSSKHLFILDANALLHRAWHALPPLTNPQGQIVNALYGTLMVAMKLITDEKPDAFVACWDTPEPTFRHKAFAAYKAQREKQADELYAQIPWIQQGLELLGVSSVLLPGFEADDLIGTIATRERARGFEVTIVTSDRDALQLIEPGVNVLAFRKGVTDMIRYDEQSMKQEYGLSPRQWVDYKTMRGDPSDNIPGVKGIGEKTATDLLQRFETIEGVLRAAHDSGSAIAPSTRQKLLAAETELPEIKNLVRIVTDAPISWSVTQTNGVSPPDRDTFIAFLRTQGLQSLVKRMEAGSSSVDRSEVFAISSSKGRSERAAAVQKTEPLVCSTVAQAKKILDAITSAQELIVCVSSGVEGSLFAGQVEGLVLCTTDQITSFPTHVLQKNEIKALLQKKLDTVASLIAHDGKMTMGQLEKLGLTVPRWDFDTMLASYVLAANERSHELSALAFRWLGTVPEGVLDAVVSAQVIAELLPILRAKLHEDSLDVVLTRFELPLIPVLYRMERAGVRIDIPYLKSLSEEIHTQKKAIEETMRAMVGRDFNPASPSQLAEVLFQDLKLSSKGIRKGKTGLSTASQELDKLRGQHPIIELIEEHREVAKMLSTYVEVLPTLADKEGRVHTTFNQAVAATGRLSSSDPNLQNIPIKSELGKKIRRAFIASPGNRLVSCDYSQIELRVVAVLAHDERMLQAFRDGLDIHIATAAAMWNVPLNEVTKKQRTIAKTINFGLIFGQGPQALGVTAGISFEEAREFIAAYFAAYEGVKTYMDETKASVRERGYVETLFGRRRPLPEINSPMHVVRAQAERMAINMPVQGTEADLMKLATIEVDRGLSRACPSAQLLLQVHDELVFEVQEDALESLAKFAHDAMEHVADIGVPLTVEVKQGKNWEEMEKIK